MAYKKFSIVLIIRLTIILITLVALAIIIANTGWVFTMVTLFIAAALQVYSLVLFVNKTNRDYARFLVAVKNGDFITSYQSNFRDSGYEEFYNALCDVIEMFRKVKIEKEAQFQYLRQIMRQLNVGVIAFDTDGVIEVMNVMATRLLRTTKVDHWDKMKERTPEFYEFINSVKRKDKQLIDMDIKGDRKQFYVEVNTITLLEEEHKVVTFQNIKSEVENKEIEAWHKLIRTMAHEIMNSLTPITSLTETSVMLLKDENGKPKKQEEITEKNLNSLATALKTIQSRTNNLLDFIGNYRKLTRIPPPNPERISVNELFEKIETLMQSEVKKHKVNILYKVFNKDMFLYVDTGQIEQVLINLINNSLTAVKTQKLPEIKVSAYKNDESDIIEVSDNGDGIETDKLDKIFIPFFSTKPHGTGIGLSLSKQVMKMHKGEIEVKSVPGEKTSFYLMFHN